MNRTKIKCGCQSGRKVVAYNSKSDMPLVTDIGQKQGMNIEKEEYSKVLYSLNQILSSV